jgi:rhodanese-related sulfurtransferase
MSKLLVGVLAALVLAGILVFLYFGLDAGHVDSLPEPPAAPERVVAEAAPVKTIAPAEVKKLLDGGGKFAFIDVRTPKEFEKWRIPQAILVPIEPRETFVDRLQRFVPDPGTEVVLFCRTGRRSEDGAALLEKRGYGHVFNMGGIIDWNYATEGKDL